MVKKISPGSHKVGSYSKSKWLVDSPAFEIRSVVLVDLETEIEAVQERLFELLTSFTAHWVIRGVGTGLITMELVDLFYIKLQMDVKAFHLDPLSFEV